MNTSQTHKLFKIVLVVLLSANFCTVNAQRVALVLSGGGAKGIAHLGVIRALEEENIPIDYVIGTSMGGVIGGMYAAGFSPKQIEGLVLTEEFQGLVSGELTEQQKYFFSQADDNAAMLSVYLSVDSSFQANFNTNLISDIPMNFAIAEQLAKQTAVANYDFDSLFVPFRALGAEIFTQEEVVMGDGMLSDAMRATLTVPMFYRPIKINNKYIFDGGLYNNFPAGHAKDIWSPDVIIGVNVSAKNFQQYPADKDEKLVKDLLFYVLISKTDSTAVGDGIFIEPDLKEYTAFSFRSAREIYQKGYEEGKRMMPAIKAKIARRSDPTELAIRRSKYFADTVEIHFDEINIKGLNNRQRKFVEHFFRFSNGNPSMSEVRRRYFQLANDEYFSNIYPRFRRNRGDSLYSFRLDIRPERKVRFDIGGAVTTRNINQFYLGLQYTYLADLLYNISGNLYTGPFYTSAMGSLRMYLPTRVPIYVEPNFIFNNFDYIEISDILFENRVPNFLNQTDRRYGMNIGIGTGSLSKYIAGISYINNDNRYVNRDFVLPQDLLDNTQLKGMNYALHFHRNSLNRKMYANAGSKVKVGVNYFAVKEGFKPGSTSVHSTDRQVDHCWMRMKGSVEKYFKEGRYSLGYMAEAVWSEQPNMSSYRSSLILAPSFEPLNDSRSLFLKDYRAYGYGAVGLRNVYNVFDRFDIRVEGYVHSNMRRPVSGEGQSVRTVTDFDKLYLSGTAGVVYHSPVGPLAATVNYFGQEKYGFEIFLHAGYLIYNRRSTE